MGNSLEIIKKRLMAAASLQKSKNMPLKAIFDLDSTLFDVSPRITKILHDFANLAEMQKSHPEACAKLLTVRPHPEDYGVKRTLMRYGFEPPDFEFVEKLVDFWKSKFFSNPYLSYDVPYPGAQSFVKELFDAGGEISYLTGRDIPRMLEGTIQQLKTYDFPLDPNHTNLVLKPNTEIDDASFKKEFFLRMNKSPAPVWFFENEPKNIHLVVEHCPHINPVFVDTVHSQKNPLPGDEVPRLQWI